MIAVARAIKERFGPEYGWCSSALHRQEGEIRDPFVQGEVDAVLTFKELLDMFQEAGIEPRELRPAPSTVRSATWGAAYPFPGGCCAWQAFTPTSWKQRAGHRGQGPGPAVLKELTEARARQDVRPAVLRRLHQRPQDPNDHGVFAKKEMLTDYINEQNRYTVRRELIETLEEFERLDLAREFSEAAVVLPQPTEEQIAGTLMLMRKFTPEDQLNCGSCGYPSCREKASPCARGWPRWTCACPTWWRSWRPP